MEKILPVNNKIETPPSFEASDSEVLRMIQEKLSKLTPEQQRMVLQFIEKIIALAPRALARKEELEGPGNQYTQTLQELQNRYPNDKFPTVNIQVQSLSDLYEMAIERHPENPFHRFREVFKRVADLIKEIYTLAGGKLSPNFLESIKDIETTFRVEVRREELAGSLVNQLPFRCKEKSINSLTPQERDRYNEFIQRAKAQGALIQRGTIILVLSPGIRSIEKDREDYSVRPEVVVYR